MKSFKQILDEASIYSLNPDGTRKLNKLESINFKHSDLQKMKGFNNLIAVNDLFQNVYKKSKGYISATGKNDYYSNQKLRNLITKDMEVEYPMVKVDDQGNIIFSNGKHAYAIANRINMEKMIAVDDYSMENAKKYGYVN